MTVLLDASVLIALTTKEHEHHEAVSTWASTQPQLATCPVVEGALVRYLVRVGVARNQTKAVLRAIAQHPKVELWPDALSYAEADLDAVAGHKQVTDAYLVSLARSHDAPLSTLDQALARTYPDDTHLVG